MRAATILLHGPLYPLLSRLPLYAGHLIEGTGDATVRAPGEFFAEPSLSDAGVYALLLTQHAGLLAAQLFLLTSISAVAWVRLGVALTLAANPIVYTFAHCVGSESLSAIGLIALAAQGWRMARSVRAIMRRDWLVFGIILTLLMLTRQVNAVFAALLPLAFLLLLLQRMICDRFRKSGRQGEATEQMARHNLRSPALAVGVGVAAIIASAVCVWVLCTATNISYRSRMGFTFTWRLQFLQELPDAERERLLHEAAQAAPPDAQRLIGFLAETLRNRGETRFNNLSFMKDARPLLFPSGTGAAARKMDYALNAMAKAFLTSNPGVFARLALHDFETLRRTTLPDLTEFLFWSTAYHFNAGEQVAGTAALSTFRDSSRDEVLALAKRHSYFGWWRGVSYNGWLAVWGGVLCAALLLARVRHAELNATAYYAAALLMTGILLLLLNCFLTEPLVRFTLPMFQTLFVSLALLLGHIGESAAASGRRTPLPA